MNRIGIFMIFDPYNLGDEYVNYLLTELCKYVSDLIIVINSCDPEECRVNFDKYSNKILIRRNDGYDAAAYADVIKNYRELILRYDELLITNDTYYGPIYSFGDMFTKMSKDDCDYWGITKHPGGHCGEIEINEHIQSYFLNFKSSIIHDNTFYDFWNNLKISDNINDVILNFEVGINDFLKKRGYKGFTYMECEGSDFPLKKEENPYLMYPYELIKEYKIPIIKRRSLDFNSDWFSNAVKALKYIRSINCYDINIILRHIKKMSIAASNHIHYNYINLDSFIYKHSIIYLYGDGKWARNMDSYFELHNLPIPMHIVTQKDSSNSNVCELSNIEEFDGVGIIIAVSAIESIEEIYVECQKKINEVDIFLPEY